MSAKLKPGNPFENDPLFIEVMKEALAIQDRFSAEPVYAKTGKGYLKSVGVSEIQKTKELQKARTNESPQEQLARSLAGHIVAGVASDEEVNAFRKFCESLG
jgi:hypothetical protein